MHESRRLNKGIAAKTVFSPKSSLYFALTLLPERNQWLSDSSSEVAFIEQGRDTEFVPSGFKRTKVPYRLTTSYFLILKYNALNNSAASHN